METTGERRADFEEFVRARGTALQRTAFLLTGDWALAEDLVQTALVKAWPRWDSVRHADPEGYVRKVLVNTQASWWRRRWRGEVPTEVLPDAAGSGDEGLHSRPSLHAALLRLPPRQRAVVVLRYAHDLSEQQVADVLDVSVGTVKSTASKALAKLRADGALQDLVDEGVAR